jgi:hypothetical protein
LDPSAPPKKPLNGTNLIVTFCSDQQLQ